MKKTLVEVKTLDKYICPHNQAIYLDGSIILTPGARDELNKRGIAIVRGSVTVHDSVTKSGAVQCSVDCVCEACIELAATGSTEKLFYSVAAVLKQDFNVTETKQLQEMSCRIVKAINKTTK